MLDVALLGEDLPDVPRQRGLDSVDASGASGKSSEAEVGGDLHGNMFARVFEYGSGRDVVSSRRHDGHTPQADRPPRQATRHMSVHAHTRPYTCVERVWTPPTGVSEMILGSRGQCVTFNDLDLGCVVRDYGLSPGQQDELWWQWKQGESIRSIARSVGAEQHHVRRFLAQSGGEVPPVARPSGVGWVSRWQSAGRGA